MEAKEHYLFLMIQCSFFFFVPLTGVVIFLDSNKEVTRKGEMKYGVSSPLDKFIKD